jgi:hypothetical protein
MTVTWLLISKQACPHHFTSTNYNNPSTMYWSIEIRNSEHHTIMYKLILFLRSEHAILHIRLLSKMSSSVLKKASRLIGQDEFAGPILNQMSRMNLTV